MGVRAGNVTYNYTDIATWGDQCNSTTNWQQSPIAIDPKMVTSSGGGMIYISSDNVDFEFAPKLNLENLSTGTAINVDYRGGEGAMSILSLSREGRSSDYELAGVHLHTGTAEHVVGNYKTDGNYHFVHLDKDGNIAVIELPYVFDDVAGSVTNMSMPETCREGGDIDSTWCDHKDYELGGFDSGAMDSQGKSIYEVLGFPRELTADDFITYKGSLTTPPCSKTVEWFVYQHEPFKFKTMLAHDTVESAFPNTINDNTPAGNVRPTVKVWSNTLIRQLDGDRSATTSNALSMVTVGFVSMLAMLF